MKLARYFAGLPIIPVTIIAFFMLLVLIADFVLIYVSGDYYNGLVTDNAYQKGLEYNKIIEAAKAQEISGLSDTIKWDNAEKKLEFCLYDKHGVQVEARLVDITLRHPITDRYDQSFTDSNNSGCSVMNVELGSGRWEVLLHAYINMQNGELDYYKHAFIIVD
ncbi:MAG: FixH family protein [Proteobacteria bacterium]|nr:FixH family protein [Pseudomonadota bacterium]